MQKHRIPTDGLLDELKQLDVKLAERNERTQDGYGAAWTLAMRNAITVRRLLKTTAEKQGAEYNDYEGLERKVAEKIFAEGKYCTDMPQKMMNHYHETLKKLTDKDLELRGMLMDSAIRVRELMWEDLKALGDEILAILALMVTSVPQMRSKDLTPLVDVFMEQLKLLLKGFRADLRSAYEAYQRPIREGIALRELLHASH